MTYSTTDSTIDSTQALPQRLVVSMRSLDEAISDIGDLVIDPEKKLTPQESDDMATVIGMALITRSNMEIIHSQSDEERSARAFEIGQILSEADDFIQTLKKHGFGGGSSISQGDFKQ